jgi:hypothetical protein
MNPRKSVELRKPAILQTRPKNGKQSAIDHSRIVFASGCVATIYLSRYHALYTQIFGKQEKIADKILALMTTRNQSFTTIADVKSQNLLNV